MPDEYPPWSRMRPIAEDAIATLSYAISCLATGNPQDAAWAAQRAFEAADQLAIFGLAGDNKNLPPEEALLSHPIVQTERERQERDMALVLQGNAGEVPDIATTETTLVL